MNLIFSILNEQLIFDLYRSVHYVRLLGNEMNSPNVIRFISVKLFKI